MRKALVLGVVCAIALMTGSALADPVGTNQSWTYIGATPGSETVFSFTYTDSASPLKQLGFQIVANSPTAYSFSTLKLTVNGTTVPNACFPRSGVSTPTIQCNFQDGAVLDGTNVKLFSFESPTVPQGNGGYLFLEDWANKAKSNTVPGPVPASVAKPGKPYVRHASLTGLKTGKPDLKLTLHQGLHAPALRSFTIGVPQGLFFPKETHPLTERWSRHTWRCEWDGKQKLKCLAETDVSSTTPTLKSPVLSESTAVKMDARAGRIAKAPFRMRVTDAKGQTTFLKFSVGV